MSELRSDRMIDAAARAAERMFQHAQDIAENYYPEAEELTLTRAEVDREIQERGHIPPAPGCTSPVCEKARAMFLNAQSQVQP